MKRLRVHAVDAVTVGEKLNVNLPPTDRPHSTQLFFFVMFCEAKSLITLYRGGDTEVVGWR